MKFKRMLRKITAESGEKRPEIPSGLVKKCNACKAAVFVEEVEKNHYICPHCGNYFRIHAYRRLDMIGDAGTFCEWDKELEIKNPLHYKGYADKVKSLQEKTGLNEAVVTGYVEIMGNPTAIAVCDGRFFMASMGENVGEKITRMVERATKERLPVIIFSCSGGARMQEGMVSLMQMAKTSAALKRHSEAGLLYISVLTDPTTGGVTASFAMLGDIILAEPNALIGFAGPRVIEQTIGQKLPKGFQRAEFLLEHGFIDKIVERKKQREVLGHLFRLHRKDAKKSFEGDSWKEKYERAFDGEDALTKRDAWEHVLLAREKNRPVGTDYIERLFDDFTELHGDRYFGDDPAVVGGIAYFADRPVTVLAQEKGKGTKENISRNFGMVSPEGYRKSLRLIKQAEKFHRPVICIVDTPGAFCGLEAEERGQGEAIARNLYELSAVKTPVLSVVIGEGGSGGALAFAVADEVWLMENAVYSVLSPEGFASIVWKDSKRAKEAASVMKLTAKDLKKLGIVEHVIKEDNLTRENMKDVCGRLSLAMEAFLEKYGEYSTEELLEHRYMRFRNM